MAERGSALWENNSVQHLTPLASRRNYCSDLYRGTGRRPSHHLGALSSLGATRYRARPSQRIAGPRLTRPWMREALYTDQTPLDRRRA